MPSRDLEQSIYVSLSSLPMVPVCPVCKLPSEAPRVGLLRSRGNPSMDPKYCNCDHYHRYPEKISFSQLCGKFDDLTVPDPETNGGSYTINPNYPQPPMWFLFGRHIIFPCPPKTSQKEELHGKFWVDLNLKP